MLTIEIDDARGAPSFKNPALMMSHTQRISREAAGSNTHQRARFGVVPQETLLFSGTLYDTTCANGQILRHPS